MRGVLFVFCSLGWVFAVPSWADLCHHSDTEFHCVNFQNNYDGDTVTFNIPEVHPLFGHEISVRVNGIDAPEIKSDDACEKQVAKQARDSLRKLIRSGQKVNLVELSRDKYFRVLADIQVDGQSVRQFMLDNNLAIPYDGGHKPDTDWCKVQQKIQSLQ